MFYTDNRYLLDYITNLLSNLNKKRMKLPAITKMEFFFVFQLRWLMT